MNLSNLSTSHSASTPEFMDVEGIQKVLHRSRASIYRYANTDPKNLNPPYNPQRLNPELRLSKTDPLLFHANEVARFARDVLMVQHVTIEVQQPTPNQTQELLQAILAELQAIHRLLEARP